MQDPQEVRSEKLSHLGIVFIFNFVLMLLGKIPNKSPEYSKGQVRNLNFQKDHEGTNTYLSF